MSRLPLIFVLLLLGILTLLLGLALGKRRRRLAAPHDPLELGSRLCGVCGFQAPSVARFCPRCGTRISVGKDGG